MESRNNALSPNARIHWVNTLTTLADSLTKPGDPARGCDGIVPDQKTMEIAFLILPSCLAKVGKQEEHPLLNDEDLEDINPLTDPVAFDTLLQDESLSEDVREIMRMKCE